MKKALVLCLLAFGGMASAKSGSASKVIEVTKVKGSNVAVYKSESSEGEQPLATLNGGDEITMLKKGKARSMIKTSGGIKGWMDNSAIEIDKVSGGATHNIKDVEVTGWLDNPSAVYILDQNNPDLNALPIDRKFDDEIVEPKDREQVERSYDEN